MGVIQKSFSGYRTTVAGGQEGQYGYRTSIILEDDAGSVGRIQFHDAGTGFPADNLYGNGRKIEMHLPSGMLPNVLDILRNEKPLNIAFTEGVGARLGTGEEPVGEAE